MHTFPPIVLLYPKKNELSVFEKMPPLGMAWIAAVLQENGFPVHFVDQQVDSCDVRQLIQELKPQLVLIG